MTSLRDRVAIVTGAAGGIGAATAEVLADRGARVVLADIKLAPAEKIAAGIREKGGRAVAVHVDLADENSIRAMIAETISLFGAVDILDNNAANLSADLAAIDQDIETMTADAWDATFRVNVRGTMLACKHVLPHMARAGRGAIVNIASNLALQGNVIQAAYSASKAAIIQMTRSIATSHGRHGIRCNAISPGLTASDVALANLPARHREIVESETLTPYLGDPFDVAHTVAFLASEEARYITGQNIVVDGGTASHIPGYAALRDLFGKH